MQIRLINIKLTNHCFNNVVIATIDNMYIMTGCY